MLNFRLLIIGFGFLLASCSEEDNLNPYPCLDGECNAYFEIDPLVSPDVYQDENGYWHISHQGYNYFTIQGQLDQLHSDYEINGVYVDGAAELCTSYFNGVKALIISTLKLPMLFSSLLL